MTSASPTNKTAISRDVFHCEHRPLTCKYASITCKCPSSSCKYAPFTLECTSITCECVSITLECATFTSGCSPSTPECLGLSPARPGLHPKPPTFRPLFTFMLTSGDLGRRFNRCNQLPNLLHDGVYDSAGRFRGGPGCRLRLRCSSRTEGSLASIRPRR